MTTYAGITDVAARWGKDVGSIDTALSNLLSVRLADAERMIKRRIPDLDTKVADADFLAELVRVESEAVLRLARNPDGYVSEGDGNYQYQLMQEISSGRLEVMPDEWDALGVATTGVFFIDATPVRGT